VPELAVDEDEAGRLLEQVLDGAAAERVRLAKPLVDPRHAACKKQKHVSSKATKGL
jgi:hypothetical protein